MPPKVCFISPEYWPLTGGTGAYVYYLSNELLKNGYKIYVVTGSNQTQDVKVNPQLDVSFLKIPKIPIVKSFMLAANSNRKLNSVRETANVDITHPQLPLTPNFAVPPNFGKTLVCTVHSTWKGRSRSHPRRTLQPPKRQRKVSWLVSTGFCGSLKKACLRGHGKSLLLATSPSGN